jgi:protein ImuB
MKRALCIRLPNWPLQRLLAARGELRERAVVLYALHASGGAKVVAYCPHLATAAAAPWADRVAGATAVLSGSGGIRAGMPLAEATALALVASAVSLHLEATDPAADRLAIEELAEWCHRFAPSVGLEETAAPQSLLLDVTGLGDLFGGEAALARRIVHDFQKRGLTARVAIADTPGAAWAVAHFADLEIPAACDSYAEAPRAILSALAVPLVVPSGQSFAAIAPLPPAALRLPAETCTLLADLGLRRIEQVAALRRETLLSRFGPLLLEKLDQATGVASAAIVARAPSPKWLFDWLFEHPTGRREMIEGALEQLVARACQSLAGTRRGVLRLECRFEFERRPSERFVVGLYRASASERHVGELVRLKLERLRFGQPVAAIRLRVLAIDRLEFRQREFFASDNRESPRDLAALVDRLSNRLGPHAVVRPWLLASAQPEFACQYQAALFSLPARETAPAKCRETKGKTKSRKAGPLASDSAAARGEGSMDRPLHLEIEPRPLVVMSVAPEGPPVRFQHAGRDRPIVRAWGPERIETGWWQGGCVRRDYYQVETAGGQRYWLFRELNTGRWFLHGTFI